MKIEDMQTLPEFFGVEIGGCVWVEGHKFEVMSLGFASDVRDDLSYQDDARALVGCLTGQLEWSKEPPKSEMTMDEEFGSCDSCGYEFNSELISEYEIKYCPKCGQKIEETTEEIIVPAMTAEEENILREIAAWHDNWETLDLTYNGTIYRTSSNNNDYAVVPFGKKTGDSKAYEILAPILEKYGEISLDDYR